MNKKALIIGSLMIASLILAWCTHVKDQTEDLSSNSSTMNSNNISNGNSMVHNMDMMHMADTEEQFITNMIPHHQEAIDSAKTILAKSTNPDMKKLAQDIVDAQTKEIAQMEGWLKSWYPNSAIKSNYMKMMPDMNNLTGSELDKAFLEWMVSHHQGAIQMAQDVLKVQHRAEVMTLANNIITTQSQEISMMQEILKNKK